MDIHSSILNLLKTDSNLLAFSAGVDSSALFHLLLENDISFAIAFVNYGIRKEAKDEEEYAKELSKRYSIPLHIAYAPKFDSNFEANARDFRYRFFEELIQKNSYNNLITAHQLNDRLEWLMMRLIRGAGVVELAGMESISQRDGYRVIRPLLNISRDEIEEYLQKNRIRYFIDSSNRDLKYERNRFRKLLNPLITQYRDGIERTFEYIDRDREIIESLFEIRYIIKDLVLISYKTPLVIDRACDKALKMKGYLITANERKLLKENCSIVVGRRWAIEARSGTIFIAPYITDIKIPKEFKEQFRLSNIPSKIRAYIYKEGINLPC